MNSFELSPITKEVIDEIKHQEEYWEWIAMIFGVPADQIKSQDLRDVFIGNGRDKNA